MTAAVILAGGASRRFGTDKTRAILDGRTVLGRVIDVVEPLVDELVVVGAWAPDGRRNVLEPVRFQGPLSGLAFGLRQISDSHALVLGGDHPLIERALLRWLIAQQGSADAIVPMGPDGPEPLVACYRAGVAASAEQLLESGQRRLRSLLEVITTTWVPEQEWRQFDPDGRSFLDVDRPSDLDEACRRSEPQRD